MDLIIDQVQFFKLIFILVIDEESNSFTSIYKIKVNQVGTALLFVKCQLVHYYGFVKFGFNDI